MTVIGIIWFRLELKGLNLFRDYKSATLPLDDELFLDPLADLKDVMHCCSVKLVNFKRMWKNTDVV